MNINIRLNKNYTTQLNKLLDEYGTDMARLNGFSDEQLSYTDFIDNFIDKATVSDASIDGNANVGSKDMRSLNSEMNKPHSKLIAFNKMFYEIQKMYGYNAAKNWLRREYVGYLYMHDAATCSELPYCFAYDLRELAEKGLFFIDQFNAQPPKHLETWTDFVGEFVSYASNLSSGAVGLPDFLIYSYYFWKKDVERGYYLGSPEEYRDQEFQRITYKLNQPYLRVNQSAFTNFTIYDRNYLMAFFGDRQFPDGDYVGAHLEEIIQYQKEFMRVASEIRKKNVMTFPVLTFSLQRQNGKFVDEEFAKWACRHNMTWGDSNFYVDSDITSLSSCCRLKNDVKTLGYCNSIGGTQLEVGSVKVSTINLARIAYESKTKEEYFEKLEEIAITNLQALSAQRHIIERNIEKGLLPNYAHKLINLDHQYSTCGIIGVYETLQAFGFTYEDEFGYTHYKEEGVEFAKEIFAHLHEISDKFEKSFLVNYEQIPGERAAAVLMQKDKFFHPEQAYDLPLYGNQWIPLGKKSTIAEKVKVSAILDGACNGGSILHVNSEAPFSNFDTAWKMLNYIADAGVTYFAFCTKISACKHNHGFYGDTCPICGGAVDTYYERIVGFFTPTKTWSKERKAENEMRDFPDLEMQLNGSDVIEDQKSDS